MPKAQNKNQKIQDHLTFQKLFKLSDNRDNPLNKENLEQSRLPLSVTFLPVLDTGVEQLMSFWLIPKPQQI